MSKRYINDTFWTDSYIEKLIPDEKLLFIYLLTNPLNNIAGIYEIRAKRIGFEIGFDVEVVETILNRFEKDKKILRNDDLIVIVNHIKNQVLNPSVIQGCVRIIDELSNANKQAVTDWVQSGLLNLTILNLTILNLTKLKTEEKPLKQKKKEIKKNKFGEFENVLLSTDEIDKLHSKMGENNTNLFIVKLDGYVESTGKKYKSHYATILNWARKEIELHVKKTVQSKINLDAVMG